VPYGEAGRAQTGLQSGRGLEMPLAHCFRLRAGGASCAALFHRRCMQHFAGVDGVLFAHQKLEAGARPGEVVALASGRIRLDHGFDARSLERALSEIGFDLGPALVNDHQIRVIHKSIVCAAGPVFATSRRLVGHRAIFMQIL
jgi:hypothetical protein